MASPLPSDITVGGLDQNSLVLLLQNIIAVVNELQADHATFLTAHAAQVTSLANFKTIYDAHTHTADGNASRTSLPDTGSPTGSPSAASAFTITASTAPATLTNATALVLTKG